MIGFRLWLAALLIMLGGCSFQQTLDAMVDEARQEQLVVMARDLCTNPAPLAAQFNPAIWAQSQPLFPQIPAQCPPAGGDDWRVTSFTFNTASNVDGSSSRQETAVMVAGSDAGPWTEIVLNFASTNAGPLQIVGWNVQRLTTRPPSLVFMDNWDSFRLYGVLAGIAFLALIGGLIFWLVRRRRRQGKGLTDA